MNLPLSLIVTGSDGRVGKLLRLHAKDFESEGFSPFWTSRTGTAATQPWNMVNGPPSDLPASGFLLHMAAVLPGRPDGADLRANRDMAEAVLRADVAAKFAHVFFLSTVAVYAPQKDAIAETVEPDPQNDYGRTKLAAEQILRAGFGDRLTILRMANLAGADALLGSQGAVTLDPVVGGMRGPVRSYIGPARLVQVLRQLLGMKAKGVILPDVLNLALPGAVAMADLLDAAGREWTFGPPRPAVIARVEVQVSRLSALVPLPMATAAAIVADLNSVKGTWR